MYFSFYSIDQIVNFSASCIIITISLISLIYMSVKKMKNKVKGIKTETLITLIVLACFISLLGVSAWKLSQYVYLNRLNNLKFGKNSPPGVDRVILNLGYKCIDNDWGKYREPDAFCLKHKIKNNIGAWSVSVTLSSIIIILCFAKLAGRL